jgi:hypothetical protein
VRSATSDGVGGLQREANATDTNKYVSITKLTRVKMLLSIAQQHQAATAKSFVASQTNDDCRAGAHAKTAKYKATRMNYVNFKWRKGMKDWCD